MSSMNADPWRVLWELTWDHRPQWDSFEEWWNVLTAQFILHNYDGWWVLERRTPRISTDWMGFTRYHHAWDGHAVWFPFDDRAHHTATLREAWDREIHLRQGPQDAEWMAHQGPVMYRGWSTLSAPRIDLAAWMDEVQHMAYFYASPHPLERALWMSQYVPRRDGPQMLFPGYAPIDVPPEIQHVRVSVFQVRWLLGAMPSIITAP